MTFINISSTYRSLPAGGLRKKTMHWLLTALLGVCFNLCPHFCLAGGILHVFTPEVDGTLYPVARPNLLISRTIVTVSESFVEVSAEQVFINDNDYSLNGVFIFPLYLKGPHTISEALINGNNAIFDVLNPKTLFPILKKITIETEDPLPLAISGFDAIVCPNVKLGIRESKSFRITYRVPFEAIDDVMDMTIPMVGERYSRGPVGEHDVLVRFKMSRAVRTCISTSNHIQMDRESVGRRIVVCRQRGIISPDDFRLVTTFGGPELNLRILCHSQKAGAGYFMAIVEPPAVKQSGESPLADLVMLLDCSSGIGQMGFELGKKAVTLLLEKLRPKDRFQIINFNSRSTKLFETLADAQPQNVSSAIKFVQASKVGGGTDLYNTILSSLEILNSKNRPSIIFLVTDGKATVGKTSPDALIDMVQRYNRIKARIFILAVGPSPDLATLDQIAKMTGGAVMQAPETGMSDSDISAWLSNIIAPLVTNLELNLKAIT
ncbi:MAG: VWA domain-containing protein, partial [Desulfomonilaceae bacterium]